MHSIHPRAKSAVLLTLGSTLALAVACTTSSPGPSPDGTGGSSAGSPGSSGNGTGGANAQSGSSNNGGVAGGCLGDKCGPGGTTANGGDSGAGGDGDTTQAGSDAGGDGSGGTSGSGGTGGGGAGGKGGGGAGGGNECSEPTTYVDLAQLVNGARSVEAEVAVLSGTAEVAMNGTGYAGTGFADMKGGEGGVEWAVSVPVTGDYTLSWTTCAAQDRPMRLDVNCVLDPQDITFASTGAWESAWQVTGTRVARLTKGLNRIRIRTTGSSGPNIDRLTISPPSCDIKEDATVVCEAEDALLTGVASVAMTGGGWTGSGFADMNGAEGGMIWFLNAPKAGKYTLTFQYTQDDIRDMTLKLNGTTVTTSLAFNDTNQWNTNWVADVTVELDLLAGANAVSLATNGGSGANFDHVSVAFVPDDGAGGAGGAGGAAAVP